MSSYIHGDNILSKMNKRLSLPNMRLIRQIHRRYIKWHEANMRITGISKPSISKKVKLLNEYKDFVNKPKYRKEGLNLSGFSSQSQLHSSVIEEFMYYLFKDIHTLREKSFVLGREQTYTNLYFSPENIDYFNKRCDIIIHEKNQDYTIAKRIMIKTKPCDATEWKEVETLIPIIAIECKTYFDKTMYEGAASTAEKIKLGIPNCLYLLATETYAINKSVDPRHSSIDQIFVLRGNSADNPISINTVWELFNCVNSHLNTEWGNIEMRINAGKMI